MHKAVCLLLPLLVGSCNQRAVGFGAVSIRPIYGWVDGCNTVKISGHGFDEGVTAKIGGTDVGGITQPDAELDQGYLFYGTVPAGATAGSYADVTVINGDGEEDVMPQAYYYVACPAAVLIEGVSQTEAVTGGTEITLTGCNLDAAGFSIRVGDTGELVPLTSVCGTGVASFTAPDRPDGEYMLYVTDAAGTVIWPTNPCPPPEEPDTDGADTDVADTDVADTDIVDTDIVDTDIVDTDVTDTDVTDTDTDSSDTDPVDTADTGTSCDEPIVLVYGGAQ